jgi:hypothetical protein
MLSLVTFILQECEEEKMNRHVLPLYPFISQYRKFDVKMAKRQRSKVILILLYSTGSLMLRWLKDNQVWLYINISVLK